VLSTTVRLRWTLKVGVLLVLAMTAPPMSCAYADDWVSRHGNCFDWKGRWVVDRDQSGAWVGNVDFVHVGGPCSPGTPSRETYNVRAVMAGSDFFAQRQSAATVCMLQGTMRDEEVRGYELCGGWRRPLPFTLRLIRRDRDGREPEWREPEGREPGWREPSQR
jgi:hypothetical protein